MSVIHLRGRILLGEGREWSDVWVQQGKIRLTRPVAPSSAVKEISGWVFPGLVDVHSHVGLVATGAADSGTTFDQARADRDSGVLAIRDAGSPGDTRWVRERSDLPRLLRAGRHLARPKRYLPGIALELDDPATLPQAVKEQARAGDGWVKLVADWIDRSNGAESDLAPLWSREQLTAAVEAAHADMARVTAHTFASESIDDLLAAGVDGIEHGTGIGEEHLDELVRRGVPVTPTLLQVGHFEAIAAQADGKYPVYAARMRRLHARRYEQVRMLHEAGVQLLVGTDAGTTIRHGSIAAECAELVAAGVPAPAVMAAASWQARRFLGLGDLVEGSSADLVVYPRDPRLDIHVLAEPRAVILRGQVVARS
jgi:imidazolonepropionase-like amidohydrolase